MHLTNYKCINQFSKNVIIYLGAKIMKLNKAIAQKIDDLRVKNGWSTYKLSRKTNLPAGTIQSIISCKTNDIKLSTLVLLTNAFGLTLKQFFDDIIFENSDLVE